ncbi:aminoacyl-histidine dipeptidase [Pseudomaricurvus alkylphenolicus]|uniref:beta-Ala-His dipeptidase n=1 Tax=Pseudomaricurvus alkylphenolicus TaxID=1306991 RepID=UPI00141E3FEC|nr:beta-Ala-His dipeptidase [Pseudomaricurvus alkylphenolicus]NIB41071.1 aminoacyl-histidine dipeptidase [Pseudomaricurvus alkylphenolicus]
MTQTKPDNYPTAPAHLWEHFYQFTQRPRPSKQEQQIRAYLIEQAQQHDLQWAQDDIGNIVIRVPATPGREDRPVVVIQNHVDMVTVKTDDKDHNFATDPLQLQVKDGWLKADRTTLGADNGLGCAAALAVMTDPEVEHPPLELLFTVDEETGLGGALNLDASLLTGKVMLNLDTEDWGEIFIGCAGGRDWRFRKALQRESLPAGYLGLKLNINGLSGGHSGIQIHQQLGNAIKLAAQWLYTAEEFGVRLGDLNAGVAHNVIPRALTCHLACPSEAQTQLQELTQILLQRWQSYLPEADQNLTVTLEPCDLDQVLEAGDHRRVRQLLLALPHGALTYNADQPADLVDLSVNLARAQINKDGLEVETSLRFFNACEAEGLTQTLLSTAEAFDLEIEEGSSYPSWLPDFSNPLLDRVKQCYRERYGETPAVKAIHAGLECGILIDKMPGTHAISFGPTIRGAHSPSERLEIETVEPFWQLLQDVLKSF